MKKLERRIWGRQCAKVDDKDEESEGIGGGEGTSGRGSGRGEGKGEEKEGEETPCVGEARFGTELTWNRNFSLKSETYSLVGVTGDGLGNQQQQQQYS